MIFIYIKKRNGGTKCPLGHQSKYLKSQICIELNDVFSLLTYTEVRWTIFLKSNERF